MHEVCTRAIIIASGRIVADETPAQLEARSRYHRAVSMRFLRATELEVAAVQLAMLDVVDSVETDPRTMRLTAFPKPGVAALPAVGAMVAKADWDVPELHLESGRLDEVFRALTQDAGPATP